MHAPLTECWDWQLQACCRGFSLNMFYPNPALRSHQVRRLERAAKSICAGCPVRSDCLEHALAGQEKFGVWGGMTAADRATLGRSQSCTATTAKM